MTHNELGASFSAWGPALVLFARQYCLSPEDVVQQAFLALLRQKNPPRDTRAWLYRAVRNAALDASKSERRRKQREQHASDTGDWFRTIEIEGITGEELQGALGELPPEQRELIVARIWGQMTLDQCVEIFGTPRTTLHRHYEAGLAHLRMILERTWHNR